MNVAFLSGFPDPIMATCREARVFRIGLHRASGVPDSKNRRTRPPIPVQDPIAPFKTEA
jgi:hypothetical protein